MYQVMKSTKYAAAQYLYNTPIEHTSLNNMVNHAGGKESYKSNDYGMGTASIYSTSLGFMLVSIGDLTCMHSTCAYKLATGSN